MKAIEIATRLGDSLLELRYYREPTERPSRWPHLLASVGLGCLMCSAIAFGVSVATAADNSAALRTWTETRPSWAFRPVVLSPIYDVVAFGGFALAIVMFATALASGRRLEAPEVGLAIPGTTRRGSASVVVAHVELYREHLTSTVRGAVVPAMYAAASLVLHVGVLSMADRSGEPAVEHGGLFEDGTWTDTQVDDAPSSSQETHEESDDMPRTSMQLAARVERAWRDRTAERVRRLSFLDDPALAREVAIVEAAALSPSDREMYAGLLGSRDGVMGGGFGFARSGWGTCCGGTGWGTIGNGRYGTIGHGSGRGSGYGLRGGRGGMRGRASYVPTVSIGQPVPHGGLDRAIIRRYLKRHIQRLTYCYEKRLLLEPRLAGVVRVRFVIASEGTVSGAVATGVDDSVAGCIADTVREIAFPRPRDGRSVQVEYPLTFRPAG